MSGYAEPVKIDIDARAKLVRAIKEAGGQRKLAREFGVPQQYISQMVNGERPLSDGILEKLGLRRTIIDTRSLVR